MGMDISVYVGPYLKIIGDLTTTVINTKKTCPDGHNIIGNSKFCSSCGKETINMKYEVKEKLSIYTILWNELESDDDLYSPEGFSKISLPNSRPNGNIRVDIENSGETNLTDVDITTQKSDEIKWFQEKYSEHIQVLKRFYGESNVKICWGLVSYWS